MGFYCVFRCFGRGLNLKRKITLQKITCYYRKFHCKDDNVESLKSVIYIPILEKCSDFFTSAKFSKPLQKYVFWTEQIVAISTMQLSLNLHKYFKSYGFCRKRARYARFPLITDHLCTWLIWPDIYILYIYIYIKV